MAMIGEPDRSAIGDSLLIKFKTLEETSYRYRTQKGRSYIYGSSSEGECRFRSREVDGSLICERRINISHDHIRIIIDDDNARPSYLLG